MNDFKKAILTTFASATSEDADKSLQDVEIVLLTSNGSFRGKTFYPGTKDMSNDPIGTLWLAVLKDQPDYYSPKEENKYQNSIWLKDVTKLEDNVHFGYLVIFIEDVVGFSLVGELGD
ncbi:hypothetical protein [Oenococcus sicerae]|uniref:hypothetical protein n=1 Tax=Oenococcus sicerae TaxID=2203724 RepID=UPI0039EBEBC7